MNVERGHFVSNPAVPAGATWSTLRAFLAALVLYLGMLCLAQSNVASASTPPLGSGPLTGSRLAPVSYTIILDIGSPPFSFRILRGEYWTDAAGQAIPWPASQPRETGDKHHQFTRITLGRAAVSLPMSPLAVGLIGMTIFLTLGYILAARVAKRRASDEPRQPHSTCTTKSN
jgi:hypothetical protein